MVLPLLLMNGSPQSPKANPHGLPPPEVRRWA